MGGKDCGCDNASKETCKCSEKCEVKKSEEKRCESNTTKPKASWRALDALSPTDYKKVLDGSRQIARLVEYVEVLGGKVEYWYSGHDGAALPTRFRFIGKFSEGQMNNLPVYLGWRDNNSLYSISDLEGFYTDAEEKDIPLLPRVTNFVSTIYEKNYARATKKAARVWANSDRTEDIFKSVLEKFTGKSIGEVYDATTAAIGLPEFPEIGTYGFLKTTTSFTMTSGDTEFLDCTSVCNDDCTQTPIQCKAACKIKCKRV